MADKILTDALKKYFGHDSFRSPQDEIVASILSGRDTLAIMPTGGGKSLCYQLPAMLLDGITLVVSPLIALMKDQVDALTARGIPAAMINSSQTWEQQCEVLAALERGELKLAYVAPERFRAQSFSRALGRVKIGLFAVDEAHCISQWGHDFRPDYMRLGETLDRLGRPVCAAFTATATPEVKSDIAEQLRLREPSVFVSGFARPNLSFNVREVSSKAEKFTRICGLIDKYKSGIIYCATRKSAEALSESLWRDGVRHTLYHGAMTPSERDIAQEDFIGKKTDVAVATNAFGMGIDRPDIRFVCHYELPGSVEALYQESGRAGRDGGESYCEMLLMYADKRVQEFFIEGANPDLPFIRNTYRVLRENADNANECFMPIDNIAEEVADIARFSGGRKTPRGKFGGSGANSMAVSSAISILRRYGFIERFDVPSSRVRGTRLLSPDADETAVVFPDGMLEEKRRRDESKLRDVLRYAYSKECRQRWILKYFGERGDEPCGKCDVCREAPQTQVFETLPEYELMEVRKALSCVARMSVKVAPREWRPRFGREKIVKCMLGSKDEKLLSAGLDKLSTYGILKEHGTKFCSELFSRMIEAGLVEIFDGEYPLAGLTDFGVSVMLGEVSELKMQYPRWVSKTGRAKILAEKKSGGGKARAKNASDSPELSTGDQALYDALAKVRLSLCARMKIPPFRIFTNAVLRQMAEQRPQTREAALELKGVGESNARFLPRFLETVSKFAD